MGQRNMFLPTTRSRRPPPIYVADDRASTMDWRSQARIATARMTAAPPIQARRSDTPTRFREPTGANDGTQVQLLTALAVGGPLGANHHAVAGVRLPELEMGVVTGNTASGLRWLRGVIGWTLVRESSTAMAPPRSPVRFRVRTKRRLSCWMVTVLVSAVSWCVASRIACRRLPVHADLQDVQELDGLGGRLGPEFHAPAQQADRAAHRVRARRPFGSLRRSDRIARRPPQSRGLCRRSSCARHSPSAGTSVRTREPAAAGFPGEPDSTVKPSPPIPTWPPGSGEARVPSRSRGIGDRSPRRSVPSPRPLALGSRRLWSSQHGVSRGIGQHDPVIDHEDIRLEIHELAGDFLDAPFGRIAEAGVAAGVVVQRMRAVSGDPPLHEVASAVPANPHWRPPIGGLRHGLPAAPDHVARGPAPASRGGRIRRRPR